MKVIIGKNGVSGKIVNDKATISHGIKKKTSLSKRTDGEISGKNVRTVGVEKSLNRVENSAPNIPKLVERKREFYSGNAPKNSSVPTPVERTSKSVSGYAPSANHNHAPKFQLAPRGKYKVIRNGATEKNELTKKSACYQQQESRKIKKGKAEKNKKAAR